MPKARRSGEGARLLGFAIGGSLARASGFKKAATLMCEAVDAYTELHEPRLADYDALLLTPKYQEANVFTLTSREKAALEVADQMREMVVEQLTQRFGELPAPVSERLKTYSVAQMRQVGRQILGASSLRDLGLEP